MQKIFVNDNLSSHELEHKSTTILIKRALLLMVSLLVVLFIIAIVALLTIVRNINQDADEHSAILLQKAIRNRVDTLTNHIKDYAWWREAYEHLHPKVDTEWAYSRQNISATLWRDFEYEGVFVLDSTGQTYYSVINGRLVSQPLQAWLADNPVPALMRAMNKPDALPVASKVVMQAGLPALVVAARITTGDDSRITSILDTDSTLVFVDLLDDKKLMALGEDYGIMEIRMQNKDAPKLAERRGVVTLPIDGQQIVFEWKSENPGWELISYILPLLTLLALCICILGVILGHNVLKKARMYDENSLLLAQSRLALAASERRFRDAAEATTDWLWETGADLCFTWLSNRFAGITGHSIEAWVGRPVTDFMVADSQPLAEWITLPGQSNHRHLLQCRYLSALGHPCYCHIAIKPIITPEGLTGYRGTATDVTLEVEAQARMQYLSRHDELTGLPNRVRMREFLERKLQAQPTQEHPLAMISLDLDKFKPVNDMFGHGAGDSVLHEVSARLRHCTRDYDLVARQGGDEFILIISDIHNRRDIDTLCERIIAELARPFFIKGNEIFIGASIGIAMAPQDAVDAGELLYFSDIALYKAKSTGRNKWVFYTSEMAEQIVQRREMENSLRDAIKHQQFRLVYQPRYNHNFSRIIAVEALLRWDHPELGLLMPDQFISVAKEIGLIIPISDWVLKTACRDAQQSLNGISVSVNISAMEFQSCSVVGRVRDALQESKLDPARLEIEITENATLWNLELMFALKKLGVKLLMDDFGTGYSSLRFLRNFPFDGIKLDQSFISNMSESDSTNAIVKTIIGLGKAFSSSVSAERVETEEQLQKLIMTECDETQGYLIGGPLSLAALQDQMAAMDSAAQG